MPAVVLQLSDVAFALICSCMLQCCNPTNSDATQWITLQSCQSLCNQNIIAMIVEGSWSVLWSLSTQGAIFVLLKQFPWIVSIPQSSRNRLDCKYWGLDCGRIAKIRKSPFWGLRGTERIAWDPRARVWACPPVWAQTWRSAVRLGLIADYTKILRFSLDCLWIGRSCQDCTDSTAIAFIPQSARLQWDCPVFGNPVAIRIG